MLRSGRLDAPGVLRHVMGREIERKYKLKKWAPDVEEVDVEKTRDAAGYSEDAI
jgi:hypothetical protein